jgi:WhiB family redox-sensing transcriptional regulator
MTDLIHQYRPEPWTEYAVCRSVGESPFFPENGDSWLDAVRICRSCPVRLQCLDYAMRMEVGQSNKTRMGVWGGLTPNGRKKHEKKWLAEQESAA